MDYDYDNGEYFDEEFADGLSLSEGRKGTAFIVDVGKAMFEKNESGETYLKMALSRLRNYLNKMALAAQMTDRVLVIFVNAPPNAEGVVNGRLIFYPEEAEAKTDNITAGLVQQIDEMLTAKDLKQHFTEQFGAGHSDADFGEVLHECARILLEDKADQKLIVVYSRNNTAGANDGLERLSTRVANLGPDVHICVNLMDLECGETPNEFWDIIDPEYKNRPYSLDPSTEFVEFSMRATGRIPFLLGEGAEIPVAVYSLVRERKPPAALKLDSKTHDVVYRTAYYTRPGAEEADGAEYESVAISNILKAGNKPTTKKSGPRVQIDQPGALYRKTTIGGRDIILSADEHRALHKLEPTGIRLIGFKNMSCLKDSHRMGPGWYLYPLEDLVTGCSKLYTALFTTCLKRKLFALARITLRGNMAPKFCALVPQKRSFSEDEEIPANYNYLYEGFHVIELPYAQNKRNLQDEYAKEARKLADQDEPILPAVAKLVEKLTADYVPDLFKNPVIQSHYHMVECLALSADVGDYSKKLDEVENSRLPFFENPGLRDELRNELDEIKSVIEGADPSAQALAKKRRQGNTSARGGGAKRGRKA